MARVVVANLRERWEQSMIRLDELPPRWAGLAGFCVFLGAGLVVLRLPLWAFVGGLVGLLLLLVWLALSGKPVVKLVWTQKPDATPSLLDALPSPSGPLSESTLLELVELAGGEFWMGEDWFRHRVRVSGFAMAKYPVTQRQYAEVLGKNPSRYQEPTEDGERPEDRPVEMVSWFDAVRFCNRLSEREGLAASYSIREPAEGTEAQPVVEWDRAANGYRLPTEFEWEYACRAGTETTYSFGDDETQLGDYAWFAGNSADRPHSVGKKKPNSWGLHDLHGNVFEWCGDWYEPNNVTHDSNNRVTLTNPDGPLWGSERVLRGGSFSFGPRVLRTASRHRLPPVNRYRGVGFRCVRGSVRQP